MNERDILFWPGRADAWIPYVTREAHQALQRTACGDLIRDYLAGLQDDTQPNLTVTADRSAVLEARRRAQLKAIAPLVDAERRRADGVASTADGSAGGSAGS